MVKRRYSSKWQKRTRSAVLGPVEFFYTDFPGILTPAEFFYTDFPQFLFKTFSVFIQDFPSLHTATTQPPYSRHTAAIQPPYSHHTAAYSLHTATTQPPCSHPTAAIQLPYSHHTATIQLFASLRALEFFIQTFQKAETPWSFFIQTF